LAALSLGAAAIHFGVTAEHFGEDVLFGLFFSAAGWFEALWATAYVIRPARIWAIVGAIGSIITVAIWIWAHFVGLPFGPEPGSIEPTTTTDLTATLFEILLAVWLAVSIAVNRRSAGGASTGLSVGVIVALLAAIGIATTVALGAAAPMAGG
jgi:hypothetical protein